MFLRVTFERLEGHEMEHEYKTSTYVAIHATFLQFCHEKFHSFVNESLNLR